MDIEVKLYYYDEIEGEKFFSTLIFSSEIPLVDIVSSVAKKFNAFKLLVFKRDGHIELEISHGTTPIGELGTLEIVIFGNNLVGIPASKRGV